MKKYIVPVSVIVGVAIIFIVAQNAGIFRKGGVKPEKKPVVAKGVVSAKKTFSKGMGGLAVNTVGGSNKPLAVRIKAFRNRPGDSSIFVAAMTSNRMTELSPGDYDVVLDTVPALIFKAIRVVGGEETVKDLGAISGSLNIKAMNSSDKPASFSLQISNKSSGLVVASSSTNRSVELVEGAYDVKIDTVPSVTKADIKVESGKETTLDVGILTGSLKVKSADDAGKVIRIAVQVKDNANNIVVSSASNRSIELLAGSYNIHIMSNPPQIKKDVKINPAEESVVEMLPQESRPAPAIQGAAPVAAKK